MNTPSDGSELSKHDWDEAENTDILAERVTHASLYSVSVDAR